MPKKVGQGLGSEWEADSQSLDAEGIFVAFRRRLLIFLAVAVAVLAVTVVITLNSTPRYSATASVMIEPRQLDVVSAESVLSGLPAESGVVDTEVEVLRSRAMAVQVVAALDLQNDPEFNGEAARAELLPRLRALVTAPFRAGASERDPTQTAVDSVRSRLNVRRAGLTYVINVTVESEDPRKAAVIANAFAEGYILEQLEAKFEATRQANTWLDERLAQLRVEVEEAERNVELFRVQNNLLSSEGSTLTEQSVTSMNEALAEARAAQAEAQARLDTARAQLARGSTGEDVGEALGSQVVQELRRQRAEVSRRVADMQGRYGPQHPEMARARRELADIDTQIGEEIRRIISNLEAQVQVVRQRTASLQGSLSSVRGSLAGNNAAAVTLRELEREAQARRVLYESYLSRFQETSAQEGIQRSDARVVSLAEPSARPTHPNKPLNMAVGLVLAVLAGSAGVIIAELLDRSLRTGADVENQLGERYLGFVPALSSLPEGKGGRKDLAAVVTAKPLSASAESLRNLLVALRYARPSEGGCVAALTSALPNEGKTTTAMALARVAALSGEKVVVVDCDARRRGQSAIGQPGWLDVLKGQVSLGEALIKDADSGAMFLPHGANASVSAHRVADSPEMQQLLAALRQRFDLVILDTPPILPVAETRTIAAQADLVLFLVRWGQTPRRAASEALALLGQTPARLAGVVLTQVDMREQARSGYGDPGYYYGAYKAYYTS